PPSPAAPPPSASSSACRSPWSRAAPSSEAAATTSTVSGCDVDGLNAGYARGLLDKNLENTEAAPPEWRSLFESGDSELVATHPGLLKLLETLRTDGNGASAEPAAPSAPAAAPEPADDLLLGGVAAAMALVKAHRMH